MAHKPNNDYTTIALKLKTYERLSRLGKFHDNFDSVVSRLLDEHELRGGSESR